MPKAEADLESSSGVFKRHSCSHVFEYVGQICVIKFQILETMFKTFLPQRILGCHGSLTDDNATNVGETQELRKPNVSSHT